MKSSDPKVKEFLQNFNVLKPIYGMNEQILLSAIRNNKIFKMVLCDIKAPEHLKPYFSEFFRINPIFKNVEVGREDIGDLMEKFAVDNNLLSKPQKMLIASYFADKLLLITPLSKWYINHGLEVTKIYKVLQYLTVKCFENFGLQVAEARRSGDSDPNKADWLKHSSFGEIPAMEKRFVTKKNTETLGIVMAKLCLNQSKILCFTN